MNYHIVMLSGGQLRHYTTTAKSFDFAFENAKFEDKLNYPNNFTENPDASIICVDNNTSEERFSKE